MAVYFSHESVPAALPQGSEPMEWIHCMLVAWGVCSMHPSSQVPRSSLGGKDMGDPKECHAKSKPEKASILSSVTVMHCSFEKIKRRSFVAHVAL